MMRSWMYVVALLCLVCAVSGKATRSAEANFLDVLKKVLNNLDKKVHDEEVNATRSKKAVTSLTAEEQQEVVDKHNSLRAQEGSSNMAYMTWSGELADKAQELTDACIFEHAILSWEGGTYDSVGQNIYITTGELSLSEGVQIWYDEKSDYNYDTQQCSAACGHYTQVVWAKTTEVGCGVTLCPSAYFPSSGQVMENAEFLACNYGPPGNYADQLPFKMGTECSQCNSGDFTCYEGLCRTADECSAAGVTCECKAACKNCAKETATCGCECTPGWGGPDCADPCEDTHHYCNANPGWPPSWCDAEHDYVLEGCPKMCGSCKAGDGSSEC